MLFWILVTAVVVVSVLVAMAWGRDYGRFTPSEAVGPFFVAAFISSIVGGIIWLTALLIVNSVPGGDYRIDKQISEELVAISTDTRVEGSGVGSIFISYAQINETRYLNYIKKGGNDAFRLSSSPDWGSEIRYTAEGETPKVVSLHVNTWNKWVSPWPVGDFYNWVFYVPEGTVQGDFKVDNNDNS